MAGQDEGGQILGIDVGGTFTDLVLLEPGGVRLAKVPSRAEDQARGVMAAIAEAGVDVGKADLVAHGTTVTTNALLQRKLARTGLITTRGFRDVLELGRRTRPQPYGMTGTFAPVIPRNLRLEVTERMDAQGRVRTPLDEDELRARITDLTDAGCEALVIHFLHAYANPAHERRAGAIAAELWPNAYITLGSDLLSESREFERGVTAAVNGSVQPIIDAYVARLSAELGNAGYDRDLLVMNGNGGMVPAAEVAATAAKTVMSGPASGVMAAAFIGRAAGMTRLLTCDMGGTSTDVALIDGPEPAVSNEIELEYAMPIHVPMVDVRSVGAGGGSIARIDAGGLIQVGPQSAGADPGPICYGKGGTEPTISDANFLLGRLDPARLNAISGGIALDRIKDAFGLHLGDPLNLTAVEAAEAVLRVANTKMAGAIRMVSLSLGADPRDYALFAFGGAGPLHAADLARELGIPRVVVPARPGLTNALGCTVADLRHDFVQTVNAPLGRIDAAALQAILSDQRARGEERVAAAKIAVEELRVTHSADMQFQGQTHVLRIPLPDAAPDTALLARLFESHYFERFRVELPELRPVLVNLNTSVIGVRPVPDLSVLIDAAGRKRQAVDARTGTRRVRFGANWHDTPVYWRDHLPLDAQLKGPAIIEQLDSTTSLGPGDGLTGDAMGNLIIEVEQ